jgi:hypothetical protein
MVQSQGHIFPRVKSIVCKPYAGRHWHTAHRLKFGRMPVIIVGRVTYVCPFCHLPAHRIAGELYETSDGVRLCLAFRHYPYGRMCITHWDKASYEAYPWKAWPITEIPSPRVTRDASWTE